MSDPDATDWVIGCNLTVQTKNEEIQGEVFAYDKGSNTVLIRQQGSTPFQSNLRLLKISYIKVSEVPAPAWYWQVSRVQRKYALRKVSVTLSVLLQCVHIPAGCHWCVCSCSPSGPSSTRGHAKVQRQRV